MYQVVAGVLSESAYKGTITSTIESNPFVVWATKRLLSQDDAATAQLARYVHVQAAIAEYVGDAGKCSLYASCRKAKFYRIMVEYNPFILDAVLEGTKQEVAY